MGYSAIPSAPEGDYVLMTNSTRDYGIGSLGIAPFIAQMATPEGGTYNFQ